MTDKAGVKKHWIFWIICILGLLWNAGGAANYLMQTNMEFVNSMPETHQAIINGRPAWATGGFAVGVFGGVIGCVLLMFGSRLALPVFIVSLLGIVLTMIHTFNVAGSGVEFGTGEMVVMAILPVLVAIFLVWYSRTALARYWPR